MIRTALRKRIEETNDEGMQTLLDNVNGNMGFMFIRKDGGLAKCREVLEEFQVPAAAKSGQIAACDVSIPAGPSGLEPSQTSFFQALNINTKIVKGMIELMAETKLCTAGEKCSMSAVALLNKLGVKPFKFGMKIRSVYQDGSVFDAAVLDITDEVLMAKFMNGVSNVAAFGREIGIPTEAGLPHMMTNAFKNIAALVAEIDYTFKEVETVKEFIADPSKFAAAASSAPAAGGAAAGGGAAAPAAAAVEEEEEEEMEFDLFD
jgi:large subunit ribosomal protein LP0